MNPDKRFLAQAEIRVATNAAGKPVFQGYAARFNSISEDLGGFREVILPGAFDKGLPGADVRCLMNHDASRILGRTKSGTCRLKADDQGLYFECEAPDTSYARDLAASIERKDIDGCSFRFYVAVGGDDWARGKDGVLRSLKDIEIDDVSIVTYPAYRATEVSMRSLECRDAFGAAAGPTFQLAHQRRLVQLAAATR